eukprot:362250-Amorphochlora_amoeboformis.AAC.2
MIPHTQNPIPRPLISKYKAIGSKAIAAKAIAAKAIAAVKSKGYEGCRCVLRKSFWYAIGANAIAAKAIAAKAIAAVKSTGYEVVVVFSEEIVLVREEKLAEFWGNRTRDYNRCYPIHGNQSYETRCNQNQRVCFSVVIQFVLEWFTVHRWRLSSGEWGCVSSFGGSHITKLSGLDTAYHPHYVYRYHRSPSKRPPTIVRRVCIGNISPTLTQSPCAPYPIRPHIAHDLHRGIERIKRANASHPSSRHISVQMLA